MKIALSDTYILEKGVVVVIPDDRVFIFDTKTKEFLIKDKK